MIDNTDAVAAADETPAVASPGEGEPHAAVFARPGADEFAPFYAGYVAQVAGGDVQELLAEQLVAFPRFLQHVESPGHRYAPGKWSIREVVGHLADAERVMAYRALRIARSDATPLAGFEENAYVAAAGFDARPLESLVAEWESVRQATLSLFRSFDGAAALRRGTANGSPVSVRALAYIVAGHLEHHLAILRTRYLG